MGNGVMKCWSIDVLGYWVNEEMHKWVMGKIRRCNNGKVEYIQLIMKINRLQYEVENKLLTLIESLQQKKISET